MRTVRLRSHQLLKLAGWRPAARARPDYFEFSPPVRTAAEFADLSARVKCYLGDASIPLYLPGSRFELDPTVVPYLEESLVVDPGWLDERPPGSGFTIVHRLTPKTVWRLLTGRPPSVSVDGRLHADAELQYGRLRNAYTWPTYPPVDGSVDRLERLSAGGKTAFILTTGPSAATVDVANVDADVRLTCNSAVRNLDLIKAFRPQIIAFADPVFHLGPSRYAAEFRRDAVRAAEAVDAVILCGADWAGPLVGMHPEIAPRLVVIPQLQGGPQRWPTKRDPTVRVGTSILTTLLLPVAFMLADSVAIAGADGRQPTENYFWSHDPKLQYSAPMMQTVFDAHPAFFRDRDYADYYDEYCTELEALIRVGEESGKVVRAVAPSWIPALRARGAAAPRQEQTNQPT